MFLCRNKNKRPMGHNSLTCIFANAMQQSSSIATATGTQIWPYHKKVKGHPSLIILTNLVDLESPMLYTKIQPQSFLELEKKIFKCFYHIWAWQPSCSMIQNHLNSVNIPSTEGPMWNLVKIGQVVSEMFKDFMVLYLYILSLVRLSLLTMDQS